MTSVIMRAGEEIEKYQENIFVSASGSRKITETIEKLKTRFQREKYVEHKDMKRARILINEKE
ncbi:hypothetical protein APHDU1_1521 [Anaplasma phagocytophilum]|nr:hypothetical protein APHDU1_1521 [Anaplasma phagocytophilum]